MPNIKMNSTNFNIYYINSIIYIYIDYVYLLKKLFISAVIHLIKKMFCQCMYITLIRFMSK